MIALRPERLSHLAKLPIITSAILRVGKHGERYYRIDGPGVKGKVLVNEGDDAEDLREAAESALRIDDL